MMGSGGVGRGGGSMVYGVFLVLQAGHAAFFRDE